MTNKIISEADKRRLLVMSARAEFIKTGKTNNISEAVEWYVKKYPKKTAGIPGRITGRDKDRPRTIFDFYERPVCPGCGAGLYLRELCSGLGKGDKLTLLICKKCKYKDYSEKTLYDWLRELKTKGG